MEVPVLEEGRSCGRLWAERRGLYLVFRAEVETNRVCRLFAVFDGGTFPLGIPAPEAGRMTLHASVPASRLPKGRLLRGELRPRERETWRRFPGGPVGETQLPPGLVRGTVYRFPWNPGERLPCEALMCFFRYVREGERGYLELELEPDGSPRV